MRELSGIETIDEIRKILVGSPYSIETEDADLLARFNELNRKRIKSKSEWETVLTG